MSLGELVAQFAVGDHRQRRVDEVRTHEFDVERHQSIDRPERRIFVSETEPLEHLGPVFFQPCDALRMAVDRRRLVAA